MRFQSVWPNRTASGCDMPFLKLTLIGVRPTMNLNRRSFVQLAAGAAAKPRRARVSGSDGAEMVYVPAGWFLQGSRPDEELAEQDELTQRKVYLDAFWI